MNKLVARNQVSIYCFNSLGKTQRNLNNGDTVVDRKKREEIQIDMSEKQSMGHGIHMKG